jgi:hypothetical protein
MSERSIDWAKIDWETVDLVELRAAAHEGLDPEWVAKYDVRSFDAALMCGGIIGPNETVDSIEAAKADQHRHDAAWIETTVTHVPFVQSERNPRPPLTASGSLSSV